MVLNTVVITIKFAVHLLLQAFLLTVSWMGTSVLAVCVTVAIALGILLTVFFRKGWKLAWQERKKNLTDSAIAGVAVWVLLILLNLFYTIPHQIRQQADSIHAPRVPSIFPPPFAYEHTKKARATLSRPDIDIELVKPDRFAIYIFNDSDVLLNKARWWFGIWDLDTMGNDGGAPLQIPQAHSDYIRPHEPIGPFAVISQEPVNSQVRNGDRLFGWVAATCPDCKRTKAYYVYAVVGKGGWIAEIPQDEKRPVEDWFSLARQAKRFPDLPETLPKGKKMLIR